MFDTKSLNHCILTVDEEQELAKRKCEGDESARNKLVECNLRLIVKIANDFKNNGVPLDDLVSAGSIGLMNAVNRFEAGHVGKDGRLVKFGTFAQFHIRHEMKKLMSELSGPVSLSSVTYGRHRKVRKLRDEIGDGWTHEEMMRRGCEMKKKSTIDEILNGLKVKVSLSERVDQNSTRTWEDVVEDEHQSNVLAEMEREECIDAMMMEMEKLSPQEQDVLRMSFGMDGEGGKKLREMGKKLGVTAERVRQIRENAIAKLKKALESRV